MGLSISKAIQKNNISWRQSQWNTHWVLARCELAHGKTGIVFFGLITLQAIIKTGIWGRPFFLTFLMLVCIWYLEDTVPVNERVMGRRQKWSRVQLWQPTNPVPLRVFKCGWPYRITSNWSQWSRPLYSYIKQLLDVWFPGEEGKAVSCSWKQFSDRDTVASCQQ